MSVDVACPHAEGCGACALLGRPGGEQRDIKRDTVVRELRKHHGLRRVRVLDTMASPRAWGYRNRAKLAVASDAHGFALGYFARGTRAVVDAPECRVIEEALVATADELRGALDANPALLKGLRFADLRCGTDPDAQHLTLVVASETLRIPADFIMRSCSRLTGLSVNVNPGTGAQVIRGPISTVRGTPFVNVSIGVHVVRVSPGSFFQVNLHVLPLIHDRIGRFFGEARSLADLYGGVGTHAIALERIAERILVVEGTPSAVADARVNLAPIAHARVMGSPVERALSAIGSARADAVVLNPSREGAHSEVLKAIVRAGAAKVAYLSCEPRTLARDLEALVELGLDVLHVEPIDMMPQAMQVEALALLTR